MLNILILSVGLYEIRILQCLPLQHEENNRIITFWNSALCH